MDSRAAQKSHSYASQYRVDSKEVDPDLHERLEKAMCMRSTLGSGCLLAARLGKPRLGGLSVEETALKKKAGREDQAKRSVETRQRRKAAQASSK